MSIHIFSSDLIDLEFHLLDHHKEALSLGFGASWNYFLPEKNSSKTSNMLIEQLTELVLPEKFVLIYFENNSLSSLCMITYLGIYREWICYHNHDCIHCTSIKGLGKFFGW